jgi:diguanylate cyclase (GGDEF)-like protein/PAS domain S-box-containing protein
MAVNMPLTGWNIEDGVHEKEQKENSNHSLLFWCCCKRLLFDPPLIDIKGKGCILMIMWIVRARNRTVFDIIIVTILSIFFAVMSLSIHFIEKVYDYFAERSILEYAEFFANFVFLYMAGLIWFTLKIWRKAENERKEMENVISSINNDVLIVLDRNGNIVMCNNSIERMLGYKAEEVLQKRTDIIFFDTQSYPEKWGQIYEKLEKEGFNVELATGRKKDSTPIPLEIITWNLSGRGGAVQLLRDITERKQMEEKLRLLSLVDELTGLYNRRGFFNLGERQLKLSRRTKKGFLLFYVDIDRMKWINDTLGHNEGDRVLLETTEIFSRTFRTSDIAARIGGDEFAIIAVDAVRESEEILLNRLQEHIKAQNLMENRTYDISLSVGSVYFEPESLLILDEMLAKADVLMYEHKRKKLSAKNMVECSA